MTNSLIPQLRADKNGKLVTRHVSDASASEASTTSIPAPSLSSAQAAPEKTEKELRIEASKAFAKRIIDELAGEPNEDKLKNLEAPLSWFTMAQIENLNTILDEKPTYTRFTSAWSVSHYLTSGRSIPLALIASIHDIAQSCIDAGFSGHLYSGSADKFAETYLKRPIYSSYLKESNVKDFRAAYLSQMLELDESAHSDGPMDYYRHMQTFSDNIDDVLHALPVLKGIMDDDDHMYMLEEGIVNVLEISEHLSKLSEQEVLRVRSFLDERGSELNSYDTEVIDEMLKNTESSVGNGWL